MKIKDFVDAEESYDPKEYAKHKDKDVLDSMDPNIKTNANQMPVGVNIEVVWDKNSDAVGKSILHLPLQVFTLIQVYLSKRLKLFGLENSFQTGELDLNIPLFVTGQGTPFRQVKLDNHLKVDSLDGISAKVTPGHFRHKVSTWAQSHQDSDVRDCEADALQHTSQVAKNFYLLNAKTKPQKLVQTFVKETNSYPKNIQATFNSAEERAKDLLVTQTKAGKQARMGELIKKREEKKLLRLNNEDYGVKRRILNADCRKFRTLMETCHYPGVLEEILEFPPRRWRHFVVRTVCVTKGDTGVKLRELFKRIYAGDLKWGVRDARFEAVKNKWPKRGVTSLRDRNSWVCACLRKYMLFFFKEN